MAKNQLGKFIVFEGGEACGKSTQIKLLQKKFKNNKNYIWTKEPGGTEIAEKIREIVITGDKDKMLPATELALIYAARYEHLHKIILPALKQGKTIVSDRFNLSSFVYQGIARGLSQNFVKKVDKLFLDNFTPDLTFLFDLEIKIAKKRIKQRNNSNERFEQFSADFHQKVRDGFLQYAKKNSKKIKIIDANKTPKTIHQEIILHF